MGNILIDNNGNALLSGNKALEVTASIDSNIVAGNIKKDVTILGVTGTYEGSGGNNGFKCTNKISLSGEPLSSIGLLSHVYTFSGELDSAGLAILYPGGNSGMTGILSKDSSSNNSVIISRYLTITGSDTLFIDKFCEPLYCAPNTQKLISHRLTFTGTDLNAYVEINDSGVLSSYSAYDMDSSIQTFYIMVIFKGVDGSYDFDIFCPILLYDD